MSLKIFFLSALASIFLLTSCKKDSGELVANKTPFKFETLTAEATEIVYSSNPSTRITAVAIGDGLSYQWSATAGDLLGSGAKITYTANASCCGGGQTITCKVKDKYGNGDAKQVSINVRN